MIYESANQYTSVVAILIESYALDAAWSMASVISFALAATGNPVTLYQVFDQTGDQVTVSHMHLHAPTGVMHLSLKLLDPGYCLPSCELSRAFRTGVDSRNRGATYYNPVEP
jgi:hypothetical protein